MLNYGGVGSGTYGGANAVIAGTAALTGGNSWFIPSGGASGASVSAPADTSEDTLATITLPVLSANAVVRLKATFTFTNNANVKTLRARFSGGAGTVLAVLAATNQVTYQLTLWIHNLNATGSQSCDSLFLAGNGAVTSLFNTATAVDTTAASTIVLTGQKATSTDTLTLLEFITEVYKP